MPIVLPISIALSLSLTSGGLWLWIWTRKQGLNKGAVVFLLLLGGLSVFIVYPIQEIIVYYTHFPDSFNSVFFQSLVEELIKLFAGLIILKIYKVKKENYIPLLIVSALGFSTFENTLQLLISSFLQNAHHTILTTLGIRILGTTTMHMLCSGILGLFLKKKWRYLLIGIILSTGLHTLFNISTIHNDIFFYLIIPINLFFLLCLGIYHYNSKYELKT